MKKFFILLICLPLCFVIFCNCRDNNIPVNEMNREIENITLPISESVDFGYSDGAGAWLTSLTLMTDGTFIGSYNNSDMGDIGNNYPNGTVYISEFSGEFSDIKKINDYTYTMTLKNVSIDKKEGEQWIEDGIRYVVSAPNGVDGNEFVLYTPETPVDTLPEEFISRKQTSFNDKSKLSVYGLYNKSTGAGFFEAK